jgi:hypothetical protein
MVLAAVAVCSPAAAQSVFVQGGLSRDVRRFTHDGQGSVFDATSWGTWAGVGAFMSSRWSAGAELDSGEESLATETATIVVAGSPVNLRTTYAARRRTVSALAGFHAGGSRVLVGCYAGLGFTAFRREIVSNAPPAVLQQPSSRSVLDERTTSAIVGVDVAIRVYGALAAVGGLRAQGLRLTGDLSGFSIRPAVGARVSF